MRSTISAFRCFAASSSAGLPTAYSCLRNSGEVIGRLHTAIRIALKFPQRDSLPARRPLLMLPRIRSTWIKTEWSIAIIPIRPHIRLGRWPQRNHVPMCEGCEGRGPSSRKADTAWQFWAPTVPWNMYELRRCSSTSRTLRSPRSGSCRRSSRVQSSAPCPTRKSL